MSDKKTLENLSADEARKLLLTLFDEGSMYELDKYANTPVCAASGLVGGINVFAYAQDGSEKSGAIGKRAVQKIKKIYELALKNGSPVISFLNSNGGNIIEGADLLAAYGDIVASSTKLSGVVPQISVVTGVAAGSAAMAAAMSDFLIMTEKAELFLVPPSTTLDSDQLSGTAQAAAKSGTASLVVKDDSEAVDVVKKLIECIPANNLESAISMTGSSTSEITADLSGKALIEAIADDDSVLELYADFGDSATTTLASLDYHTTAFVAVKGKITQNDSVKIAKFVSFADAFSIPVITLLDSEGFVPSSQAEVAGSIRDSAKLAQVYANATTPKIGVITGAAYSSAFVALAGINAGNDISLAFEGATIAPLPPKAATVFLHADKLAGESDPKAKLAQLEADYIANEASAFAAAESGLIDNIIAPSETRVELIKVLLTIESKRVVNPPKKHINTVF